MELSGFYRLSEDQIKFYEENGFLYIKDVLTKDEAQAYEKIIDEAVMSRQGEITEHFKKKVGREYFYTMWSFMSEFEKVKKFTTSERLASIPKQLFRTEHVRLRYDQALYKQANGSATAENPLLL